MWLPVDPHYWLWVLRSPVKRNAVGMGRMKVQRFYVPPSAFLPFDIAFPRAHTRYKTGADSVTAMHLYTLNSEIKSGVSKLKLQRKGRAVVAPHDTAPAERDQATQIGTCDKARECVCVERERERERGIAERIHAQHMVAYQCCE